MENLFVCGKLILNQSGYSPAPRGIDIFREEVFILTMSRPYIQVYNKTSNKFLREWGILGTADGEFQGPSSLSIFDNEIFVTDTLNN